MYLVHQFNLPVHATPKLRSQDSNVSVFEAQRCAGRAGCAPSPSRGGQVHLYQHGRAPVEILVDPPRDFLKSTPGMIGNHWSRQRHQADVLKSLRENQGCRS